MEAWIEWARGPMFRLALALLVLGLVRQLVLVGAGLVDAMRRAGDKQLPWRQIAKSTLSWLLPGRRLGRHPVFSIASVVFHVGAILTPLFLVSHVALIEASTGLAWPTLPAWLADILTVAAIVGLGTMLAVRLGNRTARALSHPSDLGWLALLLVTFVAGFLAMHPTWSPVAARTSLLVHILAANLAMALMPFTKLVHVITLPLTQLVSEVAWHFPPDAGEGVAVRLGKENQPI